MKVPIIFGLVIFSFLVGTGLHRLKDGFSPRRVLPLNRQIAYGWDKSVEEILKQTFTYVGRGRQCFAFESEDGKYILKFPRTDIYSTPFWAKVLPVKSYRKRLEKNHLEREQFLLSSFQICFDELQDQTAILAAHLGRSKRSLQFLMVKDALGCLHQLPLYKTSFILQYKKPLLIPSLKHTIDNKNFEKASQILDALVDVVVDRAKKGVLNRDRSFLRNYGFDGTKAYQIDVGSFFKNPTLSQRDAFQKSVRDSMDPVQEWLAQIDPLILDLLNKKLESIL